MNSIRNDMMDFILVINAWEKKGLLGDPKIRGKFNTYHSAYYEDATQLKEGLQNKDDWYDRMFKDEPFNL